jgi:hypothetical protein
MFQCWTDPKYMVCWWGLHNFTNPVCELDVRIGGTWRIVMRGPDGTDTDLPGLRASPCRQCAHPRARLRSWIEGWRITCPINRLKTLKRTMYGRANVELLRAKMMRLGRGFHRK